MAFPTTGILDDFNTGAGQNLTARPGWSTNIFFPGDVTLVTDATPVATATVSSGFGSNYWNTVFTNTDTWITFLVAPTGSQRLFYYVRITSPNSSIPNGYQLVWPGSGAWDFKTITAGVTASVFSGTQALSDGDSVGISSIGTLHQVWYKASGGAWTLLGSASNSAFAGPGVIAIELEAGVQKVDTFAGGEAGISPARDTHIAIPFTQGAGGGSFSGSGPH